MKIRLYCIAILTICLATSLSAQENQKAAPIGNNILQLEIKWVNKAPLPVPLQGLGDKTSTVMNKIYIIGGRSDKHPDAALTFEYDPNQNAWSRKTDVPFKHHLLSTVSLDGKIFTISGDMQNNYVYDPQTDKWKPFASCPNSRIPGAVAAVDGIIYVISGINDIIFNLSDKIDVYDPATDNWSEKKSMPNPRIASAVVIKNKIYLFGGIQPVKNERRALYVDTVEAYDPKTELWETCAKLPTGISGPAIICGDYVMLIGGCMGEIPNKELAVKEIYAYNFRSNKWHTAGSLPRSILGAGVVRLNNKIHVIGGSNGPPEWKDYAYNLQGDFKHP